MNYQDTVNTLTYRINRYSQMETTKAELEASVSNLKKELEVKDADLSVVQQSVVYYRKSQDILYEHSVGALQELLDTALSFVFYDKNYKIKINLNDKRGMKTLSFSLQDNNSGESVSLKNGCGNGVRCVVSAVLNLFVILSKGSKVLILDEKYSNLSESYVPNFFEFLNKLCESKGIRIILITHDPRFMNFCEKTYTVSSGRIFESGQNNIDEN